MPRAITKIDRRRALTIVAAVPAAVALGTGAAVASLGEDAGLLQPWNKYLPQARARRCRKGPASRRPFPLRKKKAPRRMWRGF
jgi:hypothetical protein